MKSEIIYLLLLLFVIVGISVLLNIEILQLKINHYIMILQMLTIYKDISNT